MADYTRYVPDFNLIYTMQIYPPLRLSRLISDRICYWYSEKNGWLIGSGMIRLIWFNIWSVSIWMTTRVVLYMQIESPLLYLILRTWWNMVYNKMEIAQNIRRFKIYSSISYIIFYFGLCNILKNFLSSSIIIDNSDFWLIRF